MAKKTMATAKDLRPQQPMPRLTAAQKRAIDAYLKAAGHNVSAKRIEEINSQWTG